MSNDTKFVPVVIHQAVPEIYAIRLGHSIGTENIALIINWLRWDCQPKTADPNLKKIINEALKNVNFRAVSRNSSRYLKSILDNLVRIKVTPTWAAKARSWHCVIRVVLFLEALAERLDSAVGKQELPEEKIIIRI